ncbi:MAG: hypothetical protein ACSLFD_02825 [Solirubrobacterales bacterium]
MAGRKDLLKDEAARSVGRTLGFAPLVGIAGLLFGLGLTTHRTPVIVASAIAIVIPLIAALIVGRDPSPSKPRTVAATPAAKDPSTVPAAVVAPATVDRVKTEKTRAEPVKTGASGAKAVETTVVPSGGNGDQAELAAGPKNGKAAKPKKSKKAKKEKKKKK